MSIFDSIHENQKAVGAAGAIQAIQQLFTNNDLPVSDLQTANRFYIARESSTEGRNAVNALGKSMSTQLDKVLRDSGLYVSRENDTSVSGEQLARIDRQRKQQIACAIESAVMAVNAQGSIKATSILREHTGNGTYIGHVGLRDGFGKRMRAATEAFSEQNNAEVLAQTIGYNLISGIQSEAIEMMFPRVTVPSDKVGISATIRLTQVIDDVKRQLNGNVTNLNRRNLALGMIYPEIMKNDTTRNIPVLRAAGEQSNADKFAPGAAATAKVIEGVSYDTAPLAFGKEVDIVMVSQTAEMLAKGTPDRTDSIDPDVKMAVVWLKIGDDKVGVDVSQLYLNNFVYTGQDNYKTQKLNFDTDLLMIQPSTLTYEKTAPTGALKALKDRNLSLRLSGSFSGSVNLETGSMKVHCVDLKVNALYDLTNDAALPSTDPAYAAIGALVNSTTTPWGFEQESRRSNDNLSERGDLLDSTYWTQIWAVPYRAPLTALKPVNDDKGLHTSTANVELLAQATFIRATGAGIETIYQTIDLLRSIKGSEIEPEKVPAMLGVARYLIKPLLLEGKIELDKSVQITNSADFDRALSAVYVQRIRDIGYRLFRDTDLQAVVESGVAGTTEMPTLLVLTDPMNARYIMVNGDVRTVGPDFQMIVKTTPAHRVQNNIIITFGYPGKSNGSSIDPFHFGNFLWSPEIVTSLPITRNGRTTNELTVQPRFRHIVNMAIMGVLKVEGLERLLGKRVPLDTRILEVNGVVQTLDTTPAPVTP